jgi:hypothetical protein
VKSSQKAQRTNETKASVKSNNKTSIEEEEDETKDQNEQSKPKSTEEKTQSRTVRLDETQIAEIDRSRLQRQPKHRTPCR